MRSSLVLALFLTLLGCSESKTRPETADKLKPILVLVNPPAGADVPLQPLDRSSWTPPVVGAEVTLQFHFVGPADLGTLTLTPGEVELRPLTLPFNNWTVSPAVPHDYPGLRHVTVEAKATLPTEAQLTAAWDGFPEAGFVRLRYTLVVSDGSRELPVAGDFIVYREAAFPGATENLFGSTIDAPAENEAIGDKKVMISSTVQNPQGEDLKVGWFVSAGEIKNRRSASTEWELPGSGEYTLIFTVRGKEARNGDIQIRRVSMP